MWFARSRSLACVLVLLGGSNAGVLAFARGQEGPAKPDVPEAEPARAVRPAPSAVRKGRVTDARPAVARVLPVAEGRVTSVAFGPDGRIAAGYAWAEVDRHSTGSGGVAVFDARGERLGPAPLAVQEGNVAGVAFGPDGRIAASYSMTGMAYSGLGKGYVIGNGVVVFDARGERLRTVPLAVKEGKDRWVVVTSVAFGPDGRIAAGYSPWFVSAGGSGGVVVLDGRGERLGPAPLAVQEGHVTGVAFGPDGRIAAGYSGAGGGVVIFDGRGERLGPAPLADKECGVGDVAFGPDGRIAAGYNGAGSGGVMVFDASGQRLGPGPLAIKEGRVTGVAFGPDGRIAAGYAQKDALGYDRGGGVVIFDGRGERLGPAPLAVKEGWVSDVAFGPDGRIAAGYDPGRGRNGGGGVVVFALPEPTDRKQQ